MRLRPPQSTTSTSRDRRNKGRKRRRKEAKRQKENTANEKKEKKRISESVDLKKGAQNYTYYAFLNALPGFGAHQRRPNNSFFLKRLNVSTLDLRLSEKSAESWAQIKERRKNKIIKCVQSNFFLTLKDKGSRKCS
jgi:hypothetical protein